MTWVIGRQHRAAIIGAGVGLVLIVLVLTGLGYDTDHGAPVPWLGTQLSDPATIDSLWTSMRIVLLALPLLVSLFLGAPLLARDFERGTHRLVWTQGLTRRRWLLAKITIPAAAVLVGAALVSVVAQLAIATLAHPAPRTVVPVLLGVWLYFDEQGPALLAYLVFAFTLGAAIGALVGRTLLAMVIAGIAYVTCRGLVSGLVRPHYMPPVQGTGPLNLLALRNDWLLSVSGSGATASWSIQPADRFWTFQGIEAALFLLVSIALLGLTAIWVLRRQG